jgi:hypothetical protein
MVSLANDIVLHARSHLTILSYEEENYLVKYSQHPLFTKYYKTLSSRWFIDLVNVNQSIIKRGALSPKHIQAIQTSEQLYRDLLRSMINNNKLEIAKQMVSAKIYPDTFSIICDMYEKRLDDFVQYVLERMFSSSHIDLGIIHLLAKNASLELVKKCVRRRSSVTGKREYVNFFPFAFRGSDIETIHFLRDTYGYFSCTQDNDSYLTVLCSSPVHKSIDSFIDFKTSFLSRPEQYEYNVLFKTCRYDIMKYLLSTESWLIVPQVEKYFSCMSQDSIKALVEECNYDFSPIVLKHSFFGIDRLHIYFPHPNQIYISIPALYHLAQHDQKIFSYLVHENFCDILSMIKKVNFVVSDSKLMEYMHYHDIEFSSFVVSDTTKKVLFQIKKYTDTRTRVFFTLKKYIKKMYLC